MQYRFFHIPALDPRSGECELNEFCAQHRVASIDKSLVAAGANSFWVFCVGYYAPTDKPPMARKGRIDYREVLSEADFSVFVKLRSLRKELAEREGVPAYALFTNEQLAAMVTGKVACPADLQAIAGVGEAKTRKYGELFLALLADAFTPNGREGGDAPNPD